MAGKKDIVIGVLALQGAFEEHQECIEKGTGCKTIQVGFCPILGCWDWQMQSFCLKFQPLVKLCIVNDARRKGIRVLEFSIH